MKTRFKEKDMIHKKNMDRKTMYLVLVVALLIVAAVSALLFLHFRSQSGDTALIYQDGTLVKEIDLSAVEKDYSFNIAAADGGYNTIRVTKGAIGVIDADCPDKICQNMGMVSKTNYPISCLPHKLVIRIEHRNGSKPDDVDAVVQ